MKIISQVTHLVHIGFDQYTQHQFEKHIKDYVTSISDDVYNIVNFIDEPLYSQKEIQRKQNELISDAITGIIAAYKLKLQLPKYEKTIQNMLSHIPLELSTFIESILKNKYQNKIISQYSDFSFDELDDIYETTLKYFQDQIIYNISTSESSRNDIVKNKKRRERILDTVHSLIGEERIFFSGMRDGDVNKINYAIYGNKINETWADTKIKEFTLERTKRYEELFFKNIHKRGYEFSSQTKHIIGGEYLGRCVNAYESNILMYGFQKESISINKNISLLPSSNQERYY